MNNLWHCLFACLIIYFLCAHSFAVVSQKVVVGAESYFAAAAGASQRKSLPPASQAQDFDDRVQTPAENISVYTWITRVNGRPVLRMAVRRRSKYGGRGLSLQPIGCTSVLSVTYSAAAAAIAACGAILVLCL